MSIPPTTPSASTAAASTPAPAPDAGAPPAPTGIEGHAVQLLTRVAELERRLEELQAKGAPAAPAAAAAPAAPSAASAMAPGMTADPRTDGARLAHRAAAGDRRALADYLRWRRSR